MNACDVLLTNATVLTMDDDFPVLAPGMVASDRRPHRRGWSARRPDWHTAMQVIDCGGQVLMPGLINAHTHVPMTLLRGLADDLRLDVWLLGYMMPVEREFVSPISCAWARCWPAPR